MCSPQKKSHNLDIQKGAFIKIISLQVVVLLISPLLCLHCSRSRVEKVFVDKEKWLRWAVSSEPEKSNGVHCTESSCFRFISLVMEGLTRIDTSSGKAVVLPRLCDRWEMRRPTHYIFYLKTGVRWTDGETLKAKHFLLAWKKLLQEKGPNGRQLYSVLNAKNFSEGKMPFESVGINARDDSTIELHLSAPMAGFPALLSHPSTWPIRSETFDYRGPSLGPFVFHSWNPGKEVRFVKNQNYHGGVPKLAGIQMGIVPQASMRVELFQNNETDFVDDLGEGIYSQLIGNSSLTSIDTERFVFLVFNNGVKPYHLMGVRRAFQEAIDSEEIPRLLKWPHSSIQGIQFYGSMQQPSPLLKFSPTGALEKLNRLKFDMTNYQFLDGNQLGFFTRPTLGWEGLREGQAIAENLQAQWVRTTKLSIELLPYQKEKGMESSLLLMESRRDWLEPTALFEKLAARAKVRSKQWENMVSNIGKKDPGEQSSEMADYLVGKEAAVLPLFRVKIPLLQRSEVKGLFLTSLEFWDFSNTSIN